MLSGYDYLDGWPIDFELCRICKLSAAPSFKEPSQAAWELIQISQRHQTCSHCLAKFYEVKEVAVRTGCPCRPRSPFAVEDCVQKEERHAEEAVIETGGAPDWRAFVTVYLNI
jgi:hypothetical protein